MSRPARRQARGAGAGGLDRGHRAYLASLLHRRGLRHPVRVAEALELAEQLVVIEVWTRGGLPDEWHAVRSLLDRGVYRALRELAPSGVSLARPDRIVAGGPSYSGGGGRGVEARIEDLPVARRLVAKLKCAGLLLPELPERSPRWRDDEAAYLLGRHPGRTLADLNAELCERLRRGRPRYRGRVPARVIAWLLGRPGPAAVDTAWNAIKHDLRRPGPPGRPEVFAPGPVRWGRRGPIPSWPYWLRSGVGHAPEARRDPARHRGTNAPASCGVVRLATGSSSGPVLVGFVGSGVEAGCRAGRACPESRWVRSGIDMSRQRWLGFVAG